MVGEWLAINRPRQYGKTTTLSAFYRLLKTKPDYLPLQISFERLVDEIFQDEASFSTLFIRLLEDELSLLNVSELVKRSGKRVVLMIDEIDQNSGERLFFTFLGMLRRKFLNRHRGEATFHSVILAGVRDIKTLKARIRPGDETTQNSPWNIALDFVESMSFSPEEIATMLKTYVRDTSVSMNIAVMAEQLYAFTSGYPFLVSRLCQIMDEELSCQGEWTISLLEQAVNRILKEENINFKSLIKNLENDSELYRMVYDMLLMENEYIYNADHPVISRSVRYGIFDQRKSILSLHNRIYAERIYNYLISKISPKSKQRLCGYL